VSSFNFKRMTPVPTQTDHNNSSNLGATSSNQPLEQEKLTLDDTLGHAQRAEMSAVSASHMQLTLSTKITALEQLIQPTHNQHTSNRTQEFSLTPAAVLQRLQKREFADIDGCLQFATGPQLTEAHYMQRFGVKESYIEAARKRCVDLNQPMVEVIRDWRIASPEVIAKATAFSNNLPYLPPTLIEELDPVALASLPRPNTAETAYICPLGFGRRGNLYVAIDSLKAKQLASNLYPDASVTAVVATKKTILAIIGRHFVDTRQDYLRAIAEFEQAVKRRPTSGDTTETDIQEADLAENVVGCLLRHACAVNASDIYFFVSDGAGNIKLNIDGIGRMFHTPSMEIFNRLITKIAQENVNINELPNTPQDGKVQPKSDYTKKKFTDIWQRYEFRLTMADKPEFTPNYKNRQAIVRILDRDGADTNFTDLPFDPVTRQDLLNYKDRPTGLILVTGPTGSGKSTTLYSLLAEIDPIEKSIQTAEDPVEKRMGLWLQHEIRGKTKDEKEQSARAIFNHMLRSAPHIIFWGETRNNKEIADLMLDASNTGHLVFTTLHTNDAPSAVDRLLSIGVDHRQLADSLLCVLAQRLVRKLCRHCATADDRESTELEIERVELPRKTPLRAVGCAHCEGGYRGRMMVYELLHGDTIRHLIENHEPTSRMREVGFKKGQSMYERGLLLVAQGLTTIDEVLRVTQRRLTHAPALKLSVSKDA
jgi:type II secretory ATPase GspE/PulE/Tfp pilus assembly ATPase PilB-like protein